MRRRQRRHAPLEAVMDGVGVASEEQRLSMFLRHSASTNPHELRAWELDATSMVVSTNEHDSHEAQRWLLFLVFGQRRCAAPD